ncbi:hypothetical protein ACWEP5_32515 [Nocardia niigatensis]
MSHISHASTLTSLDKVEYRPSCIHEGAGGYKYPVSASVWVDFNRGDVRLVLSVAEAYELINGLAVALAGHLTVVQDSPTDPKAVA